MNFSGVVSGLKKQYDKLMAVLSMAGLLAAVVYLGIQVGLLRSAQDDFRLRVEGAKPAYPKVKLTDVAPYEAARAKIDTPFQIEGWTNALVVPGRRVWCWDCRSPMPYLDAKCPHCGFDDNLSSTNGVAERDLDKDTIPDVWERKYGLDPQDPSDARADLDRDGFSNLEEHNAQTNPADASDRPSVIAKLNVERIVAVPFKLLFKSYMTQPDGKTIFAVNVRDNENTYFKRMNEVVGKSNEQYTIVGFKTNFVEKTRPGIGGMVREDVSELTLKRGDKLTKLILRKEVQEDDWRAMLKLDLDGSSYEVRIDQTVEIIGERFVVLSIDGKEESVVLKQFQGGKEYCIRKRP